LLNGTKTELKSYNITFALWQHLPNKWYSGITAARQAK